MTDDGKDELLNFYRELALSLMIHADVDACAKALAEACAICGMEVAPLQERIQDYLDKREH